MAFRPNETTAAGVALAGVVLASTFARASVLLDVGNANQVTTVVAGSAAASSFNLNVTATNVTIDAPILCVGCNGSVWFVENAIGPTSSFADTLSAGPFSSATAKPYFTFDSLSPGLYFFIVAVDANSPGSALWSGSSAPVVTAFSADASRGLDFLTSNNQPWVPLSAFQVNFSQGLNFTVTGDLGVPEPATWTVMLLGLGFVGLGFRSRRRLGHDLFPKGAPSRMTRVYGSRWICT